MRDQVKFSEKYDAFNSKCSICLKKTHLFNNCPLIHYVPEKNFLIKRHIFSAFQKRSKNYNLCKHTKFNALSHLSVIQSQVDKHIADNNDDDSSVLSLMEEKEEEKKSKTVTSIRFINNLSEHSIAPDINFKKVYNFFN